MQTTANAKFGRLGLTIPWDWLRLACALVILTGLMLTFDQYPGTRPLLTSVADITAKYTSVFLSALGMTVRQEGIYLFHPTGFGYNIDFSCTGFIPFIFLGVAIVFFPASPRQRITGFLFSLPYVFGVNQLRLLSLFYIGVVYPGSFEFIHEIIWECLMVAFIGGFWVMWIRGQYKKPGLTTTRAARESRT